MPSTDTPQASSSSVDSTLSASSSNSPLDAVAATAGVIVNRKRVLSTSPNPEPDSRVTRRKRPRVSSISAQFQAHLQGEPVVNHSAPDRLPRGIHRPDDDASSIDLPYPLTRSLSRRSSYTTIGASYNSVARAQSVARALGAVRLTSEAPETSLTDAMAQGMALLRRSVSVSSFCSPPPPPKVPETSADNYLRYTKVTIDFSLPTSAPVGILPLSWSQQNVLVFARGNRVHYKNLSTNASEDIIQLTRIQDTRGDLRLIECAGADQPNAVAIGTSKGYVQIWDISSKKMVSNWSTKGVIAMAWNGPVLSVGLVKGTIRHFDTRTKELPKMKEQAKRITRHQFGISSLTWNSDGKLLASGDESGTVYCWDARQTAPLDVGEMVQRRRKMQHVGPITALAWCPWKPKLFASGDSAPDGSGTIRLWNVEPYPGSTYPDKLAAKSQVTSLHFSPHCKEILSTHGPGPQDDPSGSQTQSQSASQGGPGSMANSIVVHAVPSLRHVVTVAASTKGLGGSVLNAAATKVVVAVPEENKLKLWEVWGKVKETRRHSSFMGKHTIR